MSKHKEKYKEKGHKDPIQMKEPWQMKVRCAEGVKDDPAGAFLPQSGSKRPVPHIKVNECDH